MLLSEGAEVVAADTYVPTMGMIPDPDRPGFGIPLHVARLTVNASEREPWEIWVDGDGRRFVDEGGEAIVVKTRKLERVEVVTPVEIVSRSRTGRREVLVVAPKRPSGGDPPTKEEH